MIWAILGTLFVLTLIFTLSLCRIAARADRQMENWSQHDGTGDE